MKLVLGAKIENREMEMLNLIGGCLCGEIRYEINEDSSKLFSYSCHCRDCQYITGGSPNPVIYIPKAITLTKGKPLSYVSFSDEGTKVSRYFCGKCGTHIFGESEKYPKTTVVKVGTLDDPSIFKSEMNVWISSSQPWHLINPDLPKSDKAPKCSNINKLKPLTSIYTRLHNAVASLELGGFGKFIIN